MAFENSAIDPSAAFLQDLLQRGPNDDFVENAAGGITDNDSQLGDRSDDEDRIAPPRAPEEAIDPELTNRVMGHLMPSRSIAAVCQQLKQRKNLSPESAAELDVFANTFSAEEHFAMMFAATLETRDLLKTMRPEGSWVVPDALADNIRNYATAFLLSPGLSSYRGKVANGLLAALRELNVALLPPEKESAQVKQVMTCMSKYLTTTRNTIKRELKQSVDATEEKGNIAVLAHAVVGKTGVKPTLQLYIRLAFLRWHIVNYTTLDGDKWWLKVDENLVKWRKECNTEVALSAAFTDIYNKDKARFGDPAISGLKVTELREVDGWQTVLQAYARLVESPNQKKRKLSTFEQ